MSDPGWFPDPGGEPGRLRYWNGTSWSFTTVPEADFHPPAAAAATQIPAPAQAPTPPEWRPAPPMPGGPHRRRPALILAGAIVGSLALLLGLLKLTEVPSPSSGSVPTASTRPGTGSAAPTAPTNQVTADYEGCGEERHDNGRLHWAGLSVDIASSFKVGGIAQTNGSQCMVLLLSETDRPYDGYYLGWLQPPASVETAQQAAAWISEKVTDPYSTDQATITSARDVTVGGHRGVRVGLAVGTSGRLHQDVIVLADGGRYAFLLRPYDELEDPDPDEPVLASFRID